MATLRHKIRTVTRSLARVLAAHEQAHRAAEELEALHHVLAEDEDVRRGLEGTRLAKEDKIAVFDALGTRFDWSALTLATLRILVEEDLTPQLHLALKRLIDLLNHALGRATALVRSRFPLAADQEAQLLAFLRARTGLDIRMVFRQDPRVLGGFVAEVGDLVFDATIATQLSSLKAHLTASGD